MKTFGAVNTDLHLCVTEGIFMSRNKQAVSALPQTCSRLFAFHLQSHWSVLISPLTIWLKCFVLPFKHKYRCIINRKCTYFVASLTNPSLETVSIHCVRGDLISGFWLVFFIIYIVPFFISFFYIFVFILRWGTFVTPCFGAHDSHSEATMLLNSLVYFCRHAYTVIIWHGRSGI